MINKHFEELSEASLKYCKLIEKVSKRIYYTTYIRQLKICTVVVLSTPVKWFNYNCTGITGFWYIYMNYFRIVNVQGD